MTITWHVDDPKVSHDDKDIFDAFIQYTKDTYEDVTKIKPSRGEIHYYPTLPLVYTTSGEVKIYMKEYIDKIIEEFPYMEKVNNKGNLRTLAAEYFFTVNTY